MSGDFGEILAAICQASRVFPEQVIDPLKWRLKQDRLKASPYTDVLQMVLPKWPKSSEDDRLLCAEVKAKATRGGSKPLQTAVEGARKDRDRRMNKTLIWLKERALDTGLGDMTIDQLDRFIQSDAHSTFKREFQAVVVLCSSLVCAEIADINSFLSDDIPVVVIVVDDLKQTYQAVFEAVVASAADMDAPL